MMLAMHGPNSICLLNPFLCLPAPLWCSVPLCHLLLLEINGKFSPKSYYTIKPGVRKRLIWKKRKWQKSFFSLPTLLVNLSYNHWMLKIMWTWTWMHNCLTSKSETLTTALDFLSLSFHTHPLTHTHTHTHTHTQLPWEMRYHLAKNKTSRE